MKEKIWIPLNSIGTEKSTYLRNFQGTQRPTHRKNEDGSMTLDKVLMINKGSVPLYFNRGAGQAITNNILMFFNMVNFLINNLEKGVSDSKEMSGIECESLTTVVIILFSVFKLIVKSTKTRNANVTVIHISVNVWMSHESQP